MLCKRELNTPTVSQTGVVGFKAKCYRNDESRSGCNEGKKSPSPISLQTSEPAEGQRKIDILSQILRVVSKKNSKNS